MKKRKYIFLTILLCIFFQAESVHADVIFEPKDFFWRLHCEQCVYTSRVYIVNGYGGKTWLYSSPLSFKKPSFLKNGDRYYISFEYTDKKDNVWGYIDTGGKKGWVPLVYMYPVYDSTAFKEEYRVRIREESGELNVKYGNIIYRWDYPGSEDAYPMEIQEDSAIQYDSLFKDEEGNRWGNVGYYMGNRDFWVYLDKPQDPNLPIREIHREIPKPPKSIQREYGTFAVLAVFGLLVAVIYVTKFLIRKFYGKPRDV